MLKDRIANTKAKELMGYNYNKKEGYLSLKTNNHLSKGTV